MRVDFLTLPDELILKIIENKSLVELWDIINLTFTNKRLYQLINQETALWQRLHQTYCPDSPIPATPTLQTFLATLRCQRFTKVRNFGMDHFPNQIDYLHPSFLMWLELFAAARVDDQLKIKSCLKKLMLLLPAIETYNKKELLDKYANHGKTAADYLDEKNHQEMWVNVQISSEFYDPTFTALHFAVKKGLCRNVQTILVQNQFIIDARNYLGNTPLHELAQGDNWEPQILITLLAAGANINATNNIGDTPLDTAVKYNQAQVVEALLAYGAQSGHHSSLFNRVGEYCPRGRVAKLLIEKHFSVNEADKNGNTPLHSAADKGLGEMVKDLLTANAQVDVINSAGDTPLHLVAKRSVNHGDPERPEWNREIVDALLAKNADVHCQNNKGETPLFCAIRGGDVEIIKKILAAGAKVNISDANHHTPLMCACMSDSLHSLEIINLLLAAGAEVNHRYGADTALSWAVRSPKIHIVRLLLEKGANPYIGEWSPWQTPLMLVKQLRYFNNQKSNYNFVINELNKIPQPEILRQRTLNSFAEYIDVRNFEGGDYLNSLARIFRNESSKQNKIAVANACVEFLKDPQNTYQQIDAKNILSILQKTTNTFTAAKVEAILGNGRVAKIVNRHNQHMPKLKTRATKLFGC